MRINLQVPFSEKDKVKRLGARWDMARKVWYIQHVENLTPFAAWIPSLGAAKKVEKRHHNGHAVRYSKRTDFSLPECACESPPWEDCPHTAEDELTGAELAHIRSI